MGDLRYFVSSVHHCSSAPYSSGSTKGITYNRQKELSTIIPQSRERTTDPTSRYAIYDPKSKLLS